MRLAVEAVDLEHRFDPGRGLARTVFAHAGPGCLAIVGPNGADKSTLLRIVAGLMRPNGGALHLEVDGRRVPPAERREVVGYAAPELEFYDELTLGENLQFVAEARGLRDPASRVSATLARMGLAARARDRVAALSSGMRQRLRLAFALMNQPPLLLLDEPASHLDGEGRALAEAVVAEHRREGLVLLATNDERERALGDACIELRGALGRPA